MGTKIFGIIASAAIVVVIALALINFGNYRSLLPERPIVVEEVIEIDSTVVFDSTTIAMADSLAIAEPADTLQLEQ